MAVKEAKKSSGNAALRRAKEARNDEWYTSESDVQRIVEIIGTRLKGKRIYLPCDDHEKSAFFKVLAERFDELELEELTATHLIRGESDNRQGVRISREPDGKKQTFFSLETGDCFSEECQPCWERTDVCVTNPPFSLYRAFFAKVIEAGCDYALVSPVHATNYLGVFQQLKAGACAVIRPPGFLKTFAGGGGETLSVACTIITNFTGEARAARKPSKRALIQKVDNLEYWNVPATNLLSSIPDDDTRTFAAPITYFEQDDPERWEVVGLVSGAARAAAPADILQAGGELWMNGQKLFCRVLLKRKRKDK